MIAAIALLVAAVGIVVQMLGGVANYGVVPPGLVILVVSAGIVWFLPWRWSPIAAVLVALFLIFGLFAADQASRLIEVEEVLDTIGLWIQMVSVVVALGAAVLAMARTGAAPDRR
jgi:fucose 4-O-acetylase-like acetyltransferase